VTWLEARNVADAPTIRCLAIVLDADAIAQLHPDAFAASQTAVVLCVGSCSAKALIPWIRRGYSVESPEELVGALERLPRRPRLGNVRWLHVVPPVGSPAYLAAAAVDGLANLYVKSWAAALGVSRNHLRRICVADLGAPPKTLLLLYTLTVAEEMRAAGSTRRSAAHQLGYSDAAALSRAVRSAKRRGLVPVARDRG
jgi:AraC-like DNA-binding protein